MNIKNVFTGCSTSLHRSLFYQGSVRKLAMKRVGKLSCLPILDSNEQVAATANSPAAGYFFIKKICV